MSSIATSVLKTPESSLDLTSHNDIITIDDLLRSRARSNQDFVQVAYPYGEKSSAEYHNYTLADLDRFADEMGRIFVTRGLVPKNPNESKSEIVAILAPSNLDYIVTIIALSRLGFGVFLLSNRLAPEAFKHLLEHSGCSRIVFGPELAKQVASIQQVLPVTCFQMPAKSAYDLPSPSGPPLPNLQISPAVAKTRIAIIIHSSGSTGLPKPIYQSHSACLANYSGGGGTPYRGFMTLPLYHNHGLSTLFRSIWSGKKISIYSASLPLSEPNMVAGLLSEKPESFHGVPYGLKLLAETERGIAELRNCKQVVFGGSSCPDDLGDRLVENGVNLIAHYGATEMGQLMISTRAPGDKSWNYLRPIASTKPYIFMKLQAPNVYECVILDGLRSKVMSNSMDPPNSYYTSDTFEPHPSIPDAWKYLGRLDDRITLMNGEKVLPIPFEHRIREHELIREVVMFGVGKVFPGLIIIPTAKTSELSKQELLEILMPTIDAANSKAESFGRVSREMVRILDHDTDYPATDKGTLIRAAFYKKFADLIESIYTEFELGDNTERKVLDLDDLESYLLGLFHDKLGSEQIKPDTDLFEVGVDSLMALSIRATIMRELDLGGNFLSQNVIFEFPSVNSLAAHCLGLRTGQVVRTVTEIEIMQELIQKYSKFERRKPTGGVSVGEIVVLTGATGSLGSHVLAQLLKKEQVKQVYCLVRASTLAAAEKRINDTLISKHLYPLTNPEKVVCLPSDLGREDLGLDASTISDLKQNMTAVIHSAWAVNFNLGVRSFEKQHIRGLYNLLNLCLAVETIKPARLYFCSSISAAAGTPIPATIQETYITDLTHAQSMGYARSKLVAETIIKTAAETTGMEARVLRVGQIIGDTQNGLWNTTEAIPLMLQSAKTIGALPELDEMPSWLPVDAVATAVLDLSGINNLQKTIYQQVSDKDTVYHVQNSHLFHWTKDLLPALKAAGVNFTSVSQREWIRGLRLSDQDPEKNPTIKLLDFFAEKYDNDKPGRKGLVFATEKTGQKSGVIATGYDVIGSGLMEKCLESWKKVW